MDPISALASCITIAGTVRIALDFIQDSCGAQAEIFALANEISDISVVLQQIADSIHQHNPAISNKLRDLALSAQGQLEQLGLDILEWKANPHNKIASTRQLRWLRISSKAKAWRERFRNLRAQLAVILTAISA